LFDFRVSIEIPLHEGVFDFGRHGGFGHTKAAADRLVLKALTTELDNFQLTISQPIEPSLGFPWSNLVHSSVPSSVPSPLLKTSSASARRGIL
jgi:hypothetical protein